jgi:hypothetical protein
MLWVAACPHGVYTAPKLASKHDHPSIRRPSVFQGVDGNGPLSGLGLMVTQHDKRDNVDRQHGMTALIGGLAPRIFAPCTCGRRHLQFIRAKAKMGLDQGADVPD